ncbi:Vegetative incompatibility protein HET-E-1 [Mycena sanguinolenta]|uniref:Vegetative incompatibility protein HET-E-1 n=1 Tax=Mycena sanguinolenta TaxID=230812 RepID=A0A8H6Y4G0_9AGAR|nr:Vegetative incompatibility protein HET-E-1 [Mycena sanguinolenta]
MANFLHSVKDRAHKFTQKLSPAPSRRQSRNTTPAPSNKQDSESSPATTLISPFIPESAPRQVDYGEDSSRGMKAVATAQSKPGIDRDIDLYSKSTDTWLSEPDWQAWNIDGYTISELRAWGDNHGDSNWRKLADKINESLKSRTLEAVLGFIPDSPFPAKTLVNALLSIVELGIRVPLIQEKVYKFAHDAIEYIRTLVETADALGGAWNAKDDLEEICMAVNDICKWASEHARKCAVSTNDLGDWQSKFAKAKEMFLTRTVLKIRIEQANVECKHFIKEKLAHHVATQYKFTDQSKSLCAPGTRVEIQADILKWLSPQPGTNERIFWITGIAGSGKSTLSAPLIDTLRKEGTPVAAQFFISRNIPETIDPSKIIPTIALQLAEYFPAAARIIHDTLKGGFPPSRKEQVETLLLAPIWELSKYCDIVIIIDALDELLNAAKSVLEILSIIAPLDCELPDNVRFLVTSRPEHWADISRSKTLKLTVFKQYPLLTESSVVEVHNFIIVRMQEITPDEPGWENWPDPNELQHLSDKANGLFHYAATALHWIEDQIHKHNRACRTWVIDKVTHKGGLNQLKDLYRLILTSFEDIDHPAQDAQQHAVRLASFQHVIGTILVLRKPLTIHQIIALLADIDVEDLDVAYFLQQMRSVLIPGTVTSFEEATPQIHKSFCDYIMDEDDQWNSVYLRVMHTL